MNGTTTILPGWDDLRHGGLLLDQPRLRLIAARRPENPVPFHTEKDLRKQIAQIQDDTLKPAEFVSFVLEHLCGFTDGIGTWQRGSSVASTWARPSVTGDPIKPRHLWRGDFGAVLPVFIDTESKLGIGRGTKAASQALQWLRAGPERLAILTNGAQWRLVFAGMDFDAWCQWDVDLWLVEGALAPQVDALRTLLQPALWVPEKKDRAPALVQAILDSRKGQADLSAVLGERVREAVELLVQGHGEILKAACAGVDPPDIYRAAVRVVMRLVVILFAESREKLLPRENPLYHSAYGLTGLREELARVAARSGSRLRRSHSAWPRLLALFRLVREGSHHADLPVPEYGGELFAPGSRDSSDGLSRALAVFETACLESEFLFPDSDVHAMLELLSKTRVRIRQGRSSTWVPMPVDFSDLSSEYLGVLYEGLLDFELKTAPPGDPVIFFAVGNQPALPLSRLEGMDDQEIANLLEKMKSKGDAAGEQEDQDEEQDASSEADELEDEEDDEATPADAAAAVEADEDDIGDDRLVTRTRAEEWARRAVAVGKLAPRPRGTLTEQRRLAWEQEVARKARQIVDRVVLPGEWYLVRWGGTRKGSGTFYTRPGLAVPTVHRTLRPLAFVPPVGADGHPDTSAPAINWTPRKPEDILALKVCDPACGSGTFPVAALRYLTDALYAALHHHGRISATDAGDRSIVKLLILDAGGGGEERLGDELLPCRPTDDTFEPRLKAILRRHVVERCIYGVDLDPLAVELCRLSLWIETMDRDLPFSFLDHKVKCGNSLVGAWFDTFQHYPVMAWKNREGGDKSHSNGVHFEKDARTKAIKTFVKDKLTPDLQTFLRGRTLFDEDLQARAAEVHGRAMEALERLHALPVQAAGERARLYREDVIGSPEYQGLVSGMDLWCACWFWPVKAIDKAPLPTTFASVPGVTGESAARVASKHRFFHWELEFPDVFNASRAGFDAVLGNPPWDIAKPNSKEFFSNIDPLYRSYGKQEAIAQQTEAFANPGVEEAWLDYNADFRAQSNFVGSVRSPYGDPEAPGSEEAFPIGRGASSDDAHRRWRAARGVRPGFADSGHPFRHQGSADLNLYKLFLEQAHALLRSGGRLGFVVPSGLYSDHGTGALRRLFLDACRWEWLFGFENRDKIFDIHRSFKFNPVVIEKGGVTAAIQTAFMRRRLEDWEDGESFATPYSREQVERFSPRSKAILEIQSARDLEILGKIYANSVLLGDEGPDGWGIKYSTEFHMTNDSKLFPPRPKWEEQGYRPDEYSRWLKGDWRPMEELWRELGIDPTKVAPIDPECARRIEEPDVQKTDRPGRLRCAQPPYDKLPIPRADIPVGVVLSREVDAWIRAEQVEDTALPLYEGRMIGQFDFSEKGWLSGKGRGAKWPELSWSDKRIQPQYCMERTDYSSTLDREGKPKAIRGTKLAFMDVTAATNQRTMIAAVVQDAPCGNSVPVLGCSAPWHLSLLLNSFAYDFVVRRRCGGLHLNWFVIDESPLPLLSSVADNVATIALRLGGATVLASSTWLDSDRAGTWREAWGVTAHERLRLRSIADAIAFAHLNCESSEVRDILTDCEAPSVDEDRNPKGLWRVDKEREPELRHTLLVQIAFASLTQGIADGGGDTTRGIRSILDQNGGDGWMVPDTVRLADYGLGADDRAKVAQLVASRLGPRFYDWQRAQSRDESWRECEIHASNLRVGGLPPPTAQATLPSRSVRTRGGKAAASLLDEIDEGV